MIINPPTKHVANISKSFTYLSFGYPGCPGKEAAKRMQ